MLTKMGICPFRPKQVTKYPCFETRFLKNRVSMKCLIFRKSSLKQGHMAK